MKNILQLIVLTLLICAISINAQTYSDLTTDKEIHSFIKLNKKYLGRNKLDNKIIDWQFCELYKDSQNCLMNHFVQKDSDTLLTTEILSHLQVGFKGLKQGSIVSFQTLKAKSGQKKYYRISIPIFSLDGKLAIIKISYWCGDECGSGGILIFKRIGVNKWEKVDMRNTWVS